MSEIPSTGQGNLGYTLGIVTVAALGGFLFGFDTAVINGTVSALNGLFMDPASGFAGGLAITEASRDFWIGQAVAWALIGAAIGAFAAGPITNRIGRKPAMVIASVLFLASAIGSGMPLTIWDFTFWRVLGGVAFGAASVIAPAYIAEVSPAHLRGRLGSLQQLAIVVGIFFALLFNALIAKDAGGAAKPWLAGIAAWKWMFWAEVPPAVLYGILAMGIPESPRYLVTKDRDAEARSVLEKVLGKSAADAKVKEIHGSLSAEHRPRLSDILSKKGGLFLGIVWLGIGLSVFQQFVGINVVFYYSNLLWESVGVTEDKAFLNTAIGGATNVLTTFIAIALVDKIGRKPLLIFGSLGMMLSLGVMAYVFNTAPLNPDKVALTIPAQTTGTLSIGVDARGDAGTIEAKTLDIDLAAAKDGDESDATTTITLDFRPLLGESRGTTSLVLSGLPDGAAIGTNQAAAGTITVNKPTLKPDLTGDNEGMGIVTLVCLNLYIVCFGASWGPIVWVMLGEMFSNQVRGAGLAVAAAAQWAANYAISATFPILASWSLGGAYGFYAASALVSFLFVLVLIPETKGKELESMGDLQGGKA